MVPLGEGHLRLLAREYVEHYHRERNHQGLDNRLLQQAPPPKPAATKVQRRDRLGGLLNFYIAGPRDWLAHLNAPYDDVYSVTVRSPVRPNSAPS